MPGERSIELGRSRQGVERGPPQPGRHALEGAFHLRVGGGEGVVTGVGVGPRAHQVARPEGLVGRTHVDAVDDRCDVLEGGPQLRGQLEGTGLGVGHHEDGTSALTSGELLAGLEQALLRVARVLGTGHPVVDRVLEDRGLVLPRVEERVVAEGQDGDDLPARLDIGREGAHALEHEVEERAHAAAGVEREGHVEGDLLHEQVVAAGVDLGLVSLRSTGHGRQPHRDLRPARIEEREANVWHRHARDLEAERVGPGCDLEAVPVHVLEDLGPVHPGSIELERRGRLTRVARIGPGHQRGLLVCRQPLEGTLSRGVAPLAHDGAVVVVGRPLEDLDASGRLHERASSSSGAHRWT